MRVMVAACGILIITARLASGAGGPGTPGCTLIVNDRGLARLQAPAPVQASVATLCEALRGAVDARPALTAALARHGAGLSLTVLDARSDRLSVQLVLQDRGRETAGPRLDLDQTDGDGQGLPPAALQRLAGHLVDAEPIVTFLHQP